MDLGSLCHNIFSARLATIFLLIKCLGPTFSEMELPRYEPQPRVREGGNLKLYLKNKGGQRVSLHDT